MFQKSEESRTESMQVVEKKQVGEHICNLPRVYDVMYVPL